MSDAKKNPVVPPADAGYETSDTKGRPIFIGLLLAVVILVVIIIGLSNFYTMTQEEIVYQNVLSQVDPRLDQYRAAEDSILTSYGWVDSTNGIARIPIDRAMDLMVEEAEK
ncbi:hypothetical protein KQI63_04720 [bacterium]|nr:hypothetical protein [bacterium]